MAKLSRTGVGTADHSFALTDRQGSGLVAVQAEVSGTASFRILGRVSPEAPWVEVKAASSTNFLETMAWVPYLRLEVTTGTGTVTVWVAES